MSQAISGKKNILIIVGGNYISGAEKVTLDVVQGLKSAGYLLFCITSGWTDGNFTKRLQEIEVSDKPLKLGWYYISKLMWSLDSFLNYPFALIGFLEVVKKFKYDLIYTHSYRYIILLFPLLKRKIIYHVHDVNSNNKQSKFFLKIADKKIVKYIAVSEFIKKDLLACNIAASKITVIHNGTEVVNLPGRNVKNTNEFIVGIVGQIIPRKGHEDAIKAIKLLRDRRMDITLMIVGGAEGQYAEKLRKLIADLRLEPSIVWRDFEEKVGDIYEGIDIIVAPTRNDEPFALVALEASMLSIPVIATNNGGFPESIIDGFNGFLVEANSPVQLAEKIAFFYANTDSIRKMGDNGRGLAEKKFTKKQMISKIERLIDRL